MALDKAVLSSLTRRFEPTNYLRCTPWAHRATPLGMGYGKTRYASPNDRFKLLYIAADLPTALAETISGTDLRAVLAANSISMISAHGECAKSMPLHRLGSSIFAGTAASNSAYRPTSPPPRPRPKPAPSVRNR
jgi:hypothetical protein